MGRLKKVLTFSVKCGTVIPHSKSHGNPMQMNPDEELRLRALEIAAKAGSPPNGLVKTATEIVSFVRKDLSANASP